MRLFQAWHSVAPNIHPDHIFLSSIFLPLTTSNRLRGCRNLGGLKLPMSLAGNPARFPGHRLRSGATLVGCIGHDLPNGSSDIQQRFRGR